jgi:GTP cyclohydrolase II
MIVRLAERNLRTKFGDFVEILYYDGQSESIALVMGNVSGGSDVICRIHSACIGGHVFNSIECECAAEMASAQGAIQEAGRGVIVYLEQEGKGNGHLALMESIPFKKAGHSQAEAYELAGFQKDARDFRPAAEILKELGIVSVILLTGNPSKAEDLRRFGITVSETRA